MDYHLSAWVPKPHLGTYGYLILVQSSGSSTEGRQTSRQAGAGKLQEHKMLKLADVLCRGFGLLFCFVGGRGLQRFRVLGV